MARTSLTPVIVPDEAYNATTWDGSNQVPTKNAVRDKIESIAAYATYNAIVASSGGTHTTLSAALTAASAGWRILVLDPVTESGAISSSLANLEIVGAGKDALITMAANSLTLSGANVSLRSLAFSFTSGKLTLSSTNGKVHDCYFTTANDGNQQFSFTGTGQVVNQCIFEVTYNATTTLEWCNLSGSNSIYSSNYFKFQRSDTPSSRGCIRMSGTAQVFTGNFITITITINASNACLYSLATDAVIDNNIFYTSGTTTGHPMIYSASAAVINGNTIKSPCVGIRTAGGSAVSGNKIMLNATTSAIGIELNGGSNTTVSGNTIIGAGTGAGDGINASAGDEHVITGNYISSFATGVTITSGRTRVSIVANNLAQCTATVSDSGTFTRIRNNMGVAPPDEKEFMYVKNTSGGTLGAGTLVVRKAVAAGNEITTTTTASDPNVFGVVVSSVTDTSFTYVQTLGKNTVLKADGTIDIAIGDYLTTSGTAGVARKALPGDVAIAVALEAYTTNDTNGVIDCLILPPFQLKGYTPRVSTTASSATPTINTDTTDVYGLTALAADVTSFTTNLSGTPQDGQRLWIYIVGTATRAITWGASFENGAVTLPTTTSGTTRLDVSFVWNAATSKWRCMASG